MKRGFHLIDIPPEWGPSNGLSWSWRPVVDEAANWLGVALVWPGKTLMILWRKTLPLNTMKVV